MSRHAEDLPKALASQVPAVFFVRAPAFHLGPLVWAVQARGKMAFVHIDLIAGLGKDRAGVAFLAREIGVSAQTVTNMLRGLRPDLATLEKVSRFLNVPVSALMGATGLAPRTDFAQAELVKVLGDDLSTLEIVNLVRRLPERVSISSRTWWWTLDA